MSKWITGAMLACIVLTSVGVTASSAEVRDRSEQETAADRSPTDSGGTGRWWNLTVDCSSSDGGTGTIYSEWGQPIGTFDCQGLQRTWAY